MDEASGRGRSNMQRKKQRIWIIIGSVILILVTGVVLFEKQTQPLFANTSQNDPPQHFAQRPAPTPGYVFLKVPKEYQNPIKESNPLADPYMIIADTKVKPGGEAHVDVQFHAYDNITFEKPAVLSVKNLWHRYTDPSIIESTLPNTEHVSLKKGETYSTEATIPVPNKPGYYQIEMEVDTEYTGTQAEVKMSGEPIYLLVEYDPSTLRIGAVDVNKQAMINDHKLTVKNITMGPDATEVSINLSHPRMAAGLHVKLLDQDGQEFQTLKTVSNLGGNGNDTFRFAPVLKTVKSLSFVVIGIDDQLPSGSGKPEGGGPWQVGIPLP